MYQKKRLLLVIGLLLLVVMAVAACEPQEVEVTREVEVPGAEVEVTRIVEVEVPGPEVEVEVTRVVEAAPEDGMMTISAVPFIEQWEMSGHADYDAEAFRRWDEDDPQEVPDRCAKCHSSAGFQDFLGADGSEAGVVNAPAPIGGGIECVACHNAMTVELDTVTFPSGNTVEGLGPEARCMQCHQGRSSTVSVNAGIEEAGLDPVADADTVSEEVGFSNIHYYAAAATQYGHAAMGGYEYDGKAYDTKFDHVAGFDSCVDCHNAHTLEVKVEECQACHTGVESAEDLKDVRMPGSLVDYDGDGDMEEGMYYELEGLREALYAGIQAYAAEVAGTPIVYDSGSYPYFFDDAGERYGSWTPRLAKAAYNYQTSLKDPGNFAHGGKYTVQLMYDSLEDLNSAMATPVDMSAMNRLDHGHFAGSEEAFRHWDGEEDGGIVPGRCSKCHSANGLPLLATEGVSISQPAANGLNCATCHSDLGTYELYTFEDVTFPSGATVSLALDETDETGLKSNTCINCHQGRSSASTVDGMIGETGDDELSDALRFSNIHYFAAGATLFGDDVKGAYQFADQEYLGRNEHVGKFDTCTECHNTHALEVEYIECADCHENVTSPEDLKDIRVSEVDYDGDGDVTEGMAGEVESMAEALYAAMQTYAENTAGVDPIVYDSHAYPYFFNDAGDRYSTFTPALLRAAYNYQYAQKDPGAYAHNGQYVLQVLYDTINGVGGDTSAMTRP